MAVPKGANFEGESSISRYGFVVDEAEAGEAQTWGLAIWSAATD